MIAEFLADLAMNFAIWVAGLFPEWELPPWVHDSRSQLVDMIETYNGLGVWIDWGILGVCITATATTYAVMLGIKLVRAVIAHIPQIGGRGD